MDQIKIGKFIAALRKEKGLTQEQLGEKLGVTNKTISRWENGNYTPDVEMLALLSKEFGVSINELISGERLLAEDFKKAADNNLVAALNNSTFTLKEKIAFFKRKWLREHISTTGDKSDTRLCMEWKRRLVNGLLLTDRRVSVGGRHPQS